MRGGGPPPKDLSFPQEASHRLWSGFKGFVRRHGLFRPGQAVLAAVSGGPDSVCLLHLLHLLRSSWGLRVGAAHFDHTIRGEQSRAEQEFVATLCRDNGIEFYAGSASGLEAGGKNLQARARGQRYDFLLTTAKDHGFHVVATGHTADDQAEEILFRLIRGSSLSALAGIRPVRKDGVVRPLLFARKSLIVAHLDRYGIPSVQDPSNMNGHYARNRLRQRLLPLVLEEFNPGFVEVAGRVASLFQEDDDALEGWAEEACGRVISLSPAEGMVEIDCEMLHPYPAAIRRRVLKHALRRIGVGGDRVLSDHLIRLDHLAVRATAGAYRLPGGIGARKRGGLLVIGLGVSGGTESRISAVSDGDDSQYDSSVGKISWSGPVDLQGPGLYRLADGLAVEVKEGVFPGRFALAKGEGGGMDRDKGPTAYSWSPRLLHVRPAQWPPWPLRLVPISSLDTFKPLGSKVRRSASRFSKARGVPKKLVPRLPVLVCERGVGSDGLPEAMCICGVEVSDRHACIRAGEPCLVVELKFQASSP